MDFFRDRDKLIEDPYPYFEALREQVPCPSRRAPRRDHGDRMAGSRRHLQRRADVLVVHLGDRPVPRLSGSARGRRRHGVDRKASRRDAVQRPAADARPPDAHESSRAADAADHPQAPQGERGRDVADRRPSARRLPGRRARASSSMGSRDRSRCGSSPTCSACPPEDREELIDRLRAWHARRRHRQHRRKDAGAYPAAVPLRGVRRLRRRPPRASPATTC